MDLKDTKIANKFLVGPKIGSGSFGDIYIVTMQGSNTVMALKKEDEKSKHPQLMAEAKIIKTLQGGNGIVTLHWQGQ
jgi:predicted Ser/Thr protein kinase